MKLKILPKKEPRKVLELPRILVTTQFLFFFSVNMTV